MPWHERVKVIAGRIDSCANGLDEIGLAPFRDARRVWCEIGWIRREPFRWIGRAGEQTAHVGCRSNSAARRVTFGAEGGVLREVSAVRRGRARGRGDDGLPWFRAEKEFAELEPDPRALDALVPARGKALQIVRHREGVVV